MLTTKQTTAFATETGASLARLLGPVAGDGTSLLVFVSALASEKDGKERHISTFAGVTAGISEADSMRLFIKWATARLAALDAAPAKVGA
jgi:hypothetical protein